MLTLVLENNIKIQLQNEALQHARFDGVTQILALESNPNYHEKKFKEFHYAVFIQIVIQNSFLTCGEINSILNNDQIKKIIVEGDNLKREFLILQSSFEKSSDETLTNIKIRCRHI